MDEVRNSAREEISRGRMDELTRCVHKETQFIFTELGSVPARSMATYIMDEVRGSQARYVPKPLLMVLHRCLRNGARNALVSLQYSLSGWVPRSDGDDSDNEPAAEGVSQSDESDDPDEFAGSSDQETSDIDGTEKTFYTPLTTKK